MGAAKRNSDLHGSAPDKCEVALLLIDVINDLDFPEANQLLRFARPMARKILRLKDRAKKAGLPVIYVNDNFAVAIRLSTAGAALPARGLARA